MDLNLVWWGLTIGCPFAIWRCFVLESNLDKAKEQIAAKDEQIVAKDERIKYLQSQLNNYKGLNNNYSGEIDTLNDKSADKDRLISALKAEIKEMNSRGNH